MKIFADCCDLTTMVEVADQVEGFTTNPTLMKAAGVTDYRAFVYQCLDRFPHHELSFEVVADDLVTMSHQAHYLASFGPNVYVKIPASTSHGGSTVDLVRYLSHDGVQVNVTAVFTTSQVQAFNDALEHGADSYLSIFAGRIADAGCDPADLVADASRYAHSTVSILWASAREVFNVKQAYWAGADIITLTPDLLAKRAHFGRDLTEFSRQTVEMFYNDARSAGLTLDYQ